MKHDFTRPYDPLQDDNLHGVLTPIHRAALIGIAYAHVSTELPLATAEAMFRDELRDPATAHAAEKALSLEWGVRLSQKVFFKAANIYPF